MKQRFINLIFIAVTGMTLLNCGKGSSSTSPLTSMKDTLKTITKDFVFGDERSFQQCHASTLVRTDDGNFLIAWFGGTHEKHDDVGIWLSKGVPGNWSPPVEIAKIREDPHWNPVLFRSDSGTIILFFKVGRTIDQWETWFITSGDQGITWSNAAELVPGDKGGRGPVKNKLIVLSDGTWLAPASDEENRIWNAFVDRSEDKGKTWVSSSFIEINRDSISEEGIIQPTLWESAPGKVHMMLRSSSGFVCRSDSEDYGKTWSPVYKTTIPNPNSGIDLVKSENGMIFLAYNRDGKNWGARRPLSITVSNDNGKTWPLLLDVETGNEGDEFSYPALISYGDTIVMTYTWKRERIGFWMGTVN